MTYALGIVTLFPNLKDHSSPTGFVSRELSFGAFLFDDVIFIYLFNFCVLVFFGGGGLPRICFGRQEHYYDCRSGQGYLAYRLKTVQRNSASKSKTSAGPASEKQIKMSARSALEGGPKTLRLGARSGQLSGDQCAEAIFAMKQSAEPSLVVREKMKATLEHRQKMLRDVGQSSLVLDHFPRFLDTPGLVRPCKTLKWQRRERERNAELF